MENNLQQSSPTDGLNPASGYLVETGLEPELGLEGGGTSTGDSPEPQPMSPEQRRIMIAIIAGLVLLVVVTVVSIVWLASLPVLDVARIRDIFIIFMALMSLLTSASLVIMLIQLARLLNLLQNELRPIIESTNETVNHLRGTTVFLTDNLAEPVIKLNEYLAAFTQLFATIGLVRKPPKSKPPKGV